MTNGKGSIPSKHSPAPTATSADALAAAQADLTNLAAGINNRSLNGDQRHDLLQDIQAAAGRLDQLKRGPQ